MDQDNIHFSFSSKRFCAFLKLIFVLVNYNNKTLDDPYETYNLGYQRVCLIKARLGLNIAMDCS